MLYNSVPTNAHEMEDLYNTISVAEGQGGTVGLIVIVYSDQISTIISNKIR